MKKILAWIMVGILMVSMLSTMAFAWDNNVPSMTLDTEYSAADKTVKATVNIGDYTDLCGITFKLNYNKEKLTLVSATPSGPLNALSAGVVNTAGDGFIGVAKTDIASNATTGTATTMLTAIFNVVAGQSGDVDFSITDINLADKDEDESSDPGAGSILTATVNIAAAPTAYTVTITPGTNMTFKSGEVNQTSVTIGNFMLDTYFTADVGYYFPDDYTVAEQNGVKVVRVSETEIKVTGKPTNNVNITLTDATEKPPATTYTVKVNGGTGVTANSTQTVNQGEAITDVVIEAWDNYYFPELYGENLGGSGIVVTRNSFSKITVSGTPTADVTINLPAATMKAENPNIPSVTPVHCTAAGNDGKITGVNATMEYKKGATGDTWYIVGDNTEITGLAPGKYYVRYKATPTQKASAAAEVVINAYDPTVEKVTVTYKANGGTGADYSVQVDKGSNHVILGADACGFTAPDKMRLVYWSDRADNATGSAHHAVGLEYQNLQRDLTLYAVWETTDRTVQFDANGGTGTMAAVTATYGEQYTLPKCTFTAPADKEFDCWKPDVGQGTYKPTDPYTITGNVTFVAQWKVKQGGGEQQGFTLTFKPGEGNGRDHVVNGIDAQYNLPNPGDIGIAPPNDKPNFAGWKVDGGNTVYPAGTDVPVTADATYVAQWEADDPQGDTVLVTFMPGDGKGDSFEVRVPAGDPYRLPPKPEGFEAPAGKVFAGWRVQMDGNDLGNTLYKAGQEFGPLTGNVTFVAQWETRPYHVVITTPDTDSNKTNPGTGAAPVGAPIAVVIAVAVAGAAYFVTTKKR